MVNPTIVLAVLAAVAMVALITRRSFRRASRVAKSTPAVSDSSMARLEERMARLEQAVDVIAIEMERVGESQRFLSRKIAEPQEPPES